MHNPILDSGIILLTVTPVPSPQQPLVYFVSVDLTDLDIS